MRATITLKTGRVMSIKSPGSEAKKAIQSAFSVEEWNYLQAKAPGGDMTELTAGDLSPDLWRRWMDAEVAFVCACTVNPRLWPTFPAVPTSLYWDELDEDEFVELKLEVATLAEKKRNDLKGSATTTPN